MKEPFARPGPTPKGRWTSGRWTSFVADPTDEPPRILHEQGNSAHRLRVEHNSETLLIHLSDEDGHGWTVIAIDRGSRRWAASQGAVQVATAERALRALNRPG